MIKYPFRVSLLAFAVALVAPKASFAQVELQPNLVALPASEFSVVTDAASKTWLRFATISWNSGTGPMELVAGATSTAGQDVYQRIYSSDGTSRDLLAGTFVYHPDHQHFHFENYAIYTLQPINAPGASNKQSAKTSFCLLDVVAQDLSLPGAPQQKFYTTCNPTVQGISVGWADRYGPTLEGQSFDITNSPNGDYALKIDVDPANNLLESIESDNASCVAIRIAGATTRTVQVLGGCGAQPAVTISSISPNRLKQGTSATVTVTGSGFAQGMTLGFENGSGPAPLVKNATVVSSTTLVATVSVKASGPKTLRLWDVRVSSAVLPRGFTIEP